ncbi:tetratricopeptide repeat protein [Nocardia anaemiae]|uniref:tetratricopeptide repeat protein n=1 Tax=Nocardia anaemiae TaxID=263910 RepID=UPI001471CC51|nr:tetratricopeptide repeat protein [Nocardia anaemiae]
MGKTRLAMQFAHDSQVAGWAVAVAHHHSEPTHASSAVPVTAPGLLLIVDYAERWPRDDLESLLRDFVATQPISPTDAPLPVRVLLLARPSGLWWRALANPLTKLDFALDEHRLTHTGVTDRRAMFEAARDRFAELLGVADPHRLEPVGSLADPAYELTLTVQMSALVVIDATARRTTVPGRADELSRYLLDREIDHWTTMFDRHRITTAPRQMARVVFVAALTGAVAYDQAATILTRLGIEPANISELIDDHRLCYPPLLPTTALQPLLPDRLAEDFIACTIPDPTDASSGDPWAARVPERLLTYSDSHEQPTTPDHAKHAAIVLIEAAGRARHITETVLNPLLPQHPRIAIDAGGYALLRLVELPGLDAAALAAIDASLPQRHTELDIAAAAINAALLPYRIASTTDPSELGVTALDYGARMASVGEYEIALDATAGAVALFRTVSAANPTADERNLARALANFGIFLLAAGKHQEALAPADEAVSLFRRSVAANPATYEPDLAQALGNYGAALSAVKQHQEALAPTGEAVAIRRRLAAANPAAHEPDLARSLDNLGVLLREKGQLKDAFATAREAVAIRRRLAAANPAAYEPDLARSLDNLGVLLSEAGQHEDAFTPAKEALDIRRRLAAANPAAYEPDFARSLENFGAQLSKAGRHKEAVTLAEEAVSMLRRLAAANPAVHEHSLVRSLASLAFRLSASGQHTDALAPTAEAMFLFRRWTAADQTADERNFARSLASLVFQLSKAGQHEKPFCPD